ncbi:MAG: rhomboid family intramembrane serine protease [Spirochaetaceae bacterium]|nr:rhomboid family intramembrane serine protease [Spirochaetaceae bacterium]MBP5330055.1 rhomboid family intramembrane serine protease [Spirochaetaceae bacterium]
MSSDLIHKPFKYSYNNVTLGLIIANIVLYLITNLLPQLMSILALNVVYIINSHAYWQFFTYMFVHGSFMHVFFNMLSLFIFGFSVERSLGSKEFLLFYFLSGIFCGIVSFFVYLLAAKSGYTIAYYIRLLGASGAIYSIMLAYAVIFPRSVIYLFGIVPIPAPLLILLFVVQEVFNQVTNSQSGVAHFTHLAGLLFAWLYFVIRMRVNPWKVWKEHYR